MPLHAGLSASGINLHAAAGALSSSCMSLHASRCKGLFQALASACVQMQRPSQAPASFCMQTQGSSQALASPCVQMQGPSQAPAGLCMQMQGTSQALARFCTHVHGASLKLWHECAWTCSRGRLRLLHESARIRKGRLSSPSLPDVPTSAVCRVAHDAGARPPVTSPQARQSERVKATCHPDP